ncbi:DUF1552 domain-containing protein [Aporhodopirellula aestuarii]|uniref:DUF1552 domain-containing protein n=1 Tax=Aporhodopirellula aestuarii TaxID=2950107 RepID=A0ABT0U779_9BACT|nr:DUF1552 domain-containing protein [Aporhodopirellula aestuarii]MCM2372662.1 DUF1552 domain-containing protein [Aporhodopirellula aestuarii]
MNLNALDRRRFLRGASGFALALPAFEAFSASAGAAENVVPRRLACFYLPNGVPMPLPEDPAYQDWSWFPHGEGKDFRFSKCLDPLEPLREDLTVLSGLSHPASRDNHGHHNADQFLTGAPIGGGGKYRNSISLDQVYAAKVAEQTRFSSLVMSTDGGTGPERKAHTISFNSQGRPIPAENKPKRIFDMLFAKKDEDAARRLALSQSVLDHLMEDASSLQRQLSTHDRATFEEFLSSVRDTEINVTKSARWINLPLPTVDVDHLSLDITAEDPREYMQTMYELIYLAFKTDSTRVATYQFGKEVSKGISDYLARAVGLPLTHQLSHQTKKPGGWKNFGTFCRFLSEEFGRFAGRLKATPEPAGEGSMLDNTLLLFGSASSAFHLSRNYPLILAGGKSMGFRHGQYLDYAGENAYRGGWIKGQPEPYKMRPSHNDLPLSNLFVTMLQRLGVETETFADNTGTISDV